jgi:hypothetical protein
MFSSIAIENYAALTLLTRLNLAGFGESINASETA